jgi:hypothetical protein
MAFTGGCRLYFKSQRNENFLKKIGYIVGNFSGVANLLKGNERSADIQRGFMRGNRSKWKTSISTVEIVAKWNSDFFIQLFQTGP